MRGEQQLHGVRPVGAESARRILPGFDRELDACVGHRELAQLGPGTLGELVSSPDAHVVKLTRQLAQLRSQPGAGVA